jgi:hypothetical protein
MPVSRSLSASAAPPAGASSRDGTRPPAVATPPAIAPAAASPSAPPAESPKRAPWRDELVGQITGQAFGDDDPEFLRYGAPVPLAAAQAHGGPQDFVFAVENEPHDPDDVFARLRWGGQFVYASRSRRRVAEMNERFGQRGFETMPRPGLVRRTRSRFGFALPSWLPLPLLSSTFHYFVARKVNLVLPKQLSERFTYHVQLVPADRPARGYVVLKEVPSVAKVMSRLKAKFPEAATDLIERRALKFTEKIFPLFLTREAAILQILQRDLPPAYARRVPQPVGIEHDARGYVRRLKMNWMRAAVPSATGRPLTQMEFARQATDLLQAIHERVRIIHLDLRLDNVVITENGVCFVDFGSAVREGENIQGNPLLANLYDELMRTSQIQRMIEKMTLSGAVTSHLIQHAYGRVDKQVDLFYLAMQMTNPLANPDFTGLVTVDPDSKEAAALAVLKEEVLKPRDPQNPTYRTAADVLRAVMRIEQDLKASPVPPAKPKITIFSEPVRAG